MSLHRIALASALPLLLCACGGPVADNPDMTATSDAATTPPGPDLAPPPAICRTPSAPTGAWYTEVTSQMGLAASATLTPLATTIRAGDLDGDGYADIIATEPHSDRDTDTKRERFLFLNRPSPDDPSGKKRIFVDFTKESNFLATRDGSWGYSFGTANLADVDNDGDLDIVVAPQSDTSDPGGCLLNDGTAHFTLAPSSDLDLDLAGFGSASSALVDFDADGIIDFVPGTFQYPPPNVNPPLFLKGAGDGRYSDVTAMIGVNTVIGGNYADSTNFPSMYGVTACDLDGDGNQDILYADYGREPNFVYMNDGAKFSLLDRSLGIAYDDRMDYSDDQSYRCYCMNRPGTCMPPPPPPDDVSICTAFNPAPPAPQTLTDGRGWGPGYSDQFYRLGGNNFSLACADIDNDGDMDLMSACIRHGDVGSDSDPSELIINNTPPGQPLTKFSRPGGTVTGIDRSSTEVGLDWNEGDQTPVVADLDLDGLKDIFLASSDYPDDHAWVWHQKPDHTFTDVTSISHIGQKEAHGVAFADFDHDGDLDVAIGTSSARGGPVAALRIYQNNVGQDSNLVQIQLEGKGAGHTNRSAIGARVKVTAGGQTQLQEVSGGYGCTSTQNDLVLTFGLGATCTIDSIEVRWLDGKKTTATFTGVLANYRVLITEGETAVRYVSLSP